MADNIISKLLSINVSLPKEVQYKGKTVTTGIYKEPIGGKVRVKTLNLDGDGQADLIGHGGEMRAVYVYSHHHYDFWQKELDRVDFSMGQFGENFTVESMSDEDIHIGDQFKIGSAIFEVSQPRVPCYKLAMKMGVDDFYSRILKSGKLGFYFRVLEEGEVQAGDDIILVKSHPRKMSVNQVNSLMYFDKENFEGFREALKVTALSPGWKSTFQDRLTKENISLQSEHSYYKLLVENKVKESSTITSFYLRSINNEALPNFLPGQFLPIKLDIPGQYKPVLRTYSISNAPGSSTYRLTIKREAAPPDIPDAYPGISSNYFHDHVEKGSEILASEPRGKFYLNTEHDRPIVLISAGVGLTPMVSMLESLSKQSSDKQVWYIHGARNSEELAMGRQVREIADTLKKAAINICYSRPKPSDIIGQDYEHEGRVNLTLVQKVVGTQDAEFYICGPAVFMKSLFDELVEWGVSESSIHYEFFGPAAKMSQSKDSNLVGRNNETPECSEDIEILFSKSGIKTQWNPSFDSILELAEANGLSPDFSCRSGICQTCESKLITGNVSYSPEPLQEPEEGQILICCAKPKNNLEVDL